MRWLLGLIMVGCSGATSEDAAQDAVVEASVDTLAGDAAGDVARDDGVVIDSANEAAADALMDGGNDVTAETCSPTPAAEACAIPDGFAYPHCGDVPNGCGGTISCGTCEGACTRAWSGPDSPPGGMCVCAGGYDSTKKCLTASSKPGRSITCVNKAEGLYVSGNPECRDVTPTGAPFKVWCCP
jgi:hypothetical protein